MSSSASSSNQDTLPEGFESFLLTCKAVFTIGKGYIPRHNKLKRTWQHFGYKHHLESYHHLVSAIELLHVIVQEPRIARYIQDADFKYEQAVDNCKPTLIEKLQTDEKTNAGRLRLLEESPYLRAAKQDPTEWLNAILGKEGRKYATAFLFTLLPNVRELATPAF